MRDQREHVLSIPKPTRAQVEMLRLRVTSGTTESVAWRTWLPARSGCLVSLSSILSSPNIVEEIRAARSLGAGDTVEGRGQRPIWHRDRAPIEEEPRSAWGGDSGRRESSLPERCLRGLAWTRSSERPVAPDPEVRRKRRGQNPRCPAERSSGADHENQRVEAENASLKRRHSSIHYFLFFAPFPDGFAGGAVGASETPGAELPARYLEMDSALPMSLKDCSDEKASA